MALKRTGGRPLGARELPNTFATSPARYSSTPKQERTSPASKMNNGRFDAFQENDLSTKSPSRVRSNGQVKKYIENIENTSPAPRSNYNPSPIASTPSQSTIGRAVPEVTTNVSKQSHRAALAPASPSTPKIARTPSQVSQLSAKFEGTTLQEPQSPSSSSEVSRNSPSSGSNRINSVASSSPSPSRTRTMASRASPLPYDSQSIPTKMRFQMQAETPSYLSSPTSPLKTRPASPTTLKEFNRFQSPESVHAQARSEAIQLSKIKSRSPPASPFLKQAATWEISQPKAASRPYKPMAENTSKIEPSMLERSRTANTKKATQRSTAQHYETQLQRLPTKLELNGYSQPPRVESQFHESPGIPQEVFTPNDISEPFGVPATPASLGSSISSCSSYSVGSISRHDTTGSIKSNSSASSTYSFIAAQPSPKLGKTPLLPPPGIGQTTPSIIERTLDEEQAQPDEVIHHESQDPKQAGIEASPDFVLEANKSEVEDETHEAVSEEYIVNRRKPGSPHCPAPVHKIMDCRQPSSIASFQPDAAGSRYNLHLDDWSAPAAAPRVQSSLIFSEAASSTRRSSASSTSQMSINTAYTNITVPSTRGASPVSNNFLSKGSAASNISDPFEFDSATTTTTPTKVSTPIDRLLQDGLFCNILFLYLLIIYLTA